MAILGSGSPLLHGKITSYGPLSMFLTYIYRLKRLERRQSTVMKVIGLMMVVMGILLLTIGMYALACSEDSYPFLAPQPFFIVIGLLLFLFYGTSQLSASLGILLMSETYFIGLFAAILPFLLSGMNIVDAIYEGISGFTTTGSSIFNDHDFLAGSHQIMVWRGQIEWVGGLTTILVFVNLLPLIGIGAKNLGSSEFGATDSEYSKDVKSSAIEFFKVYVALTALETLLLFAIGLCGVDSDRLHGWQCISIAMSNVATGGLLPFSDSMASFSFPVQFVTLVFMIFGASNFFLTILSIIRRRILWYTSKEWLTMIQLFVTCSAIVCFSLYYGGNHDFHVIWESFYSIVSAGTSTGFAIADYSTWSLMQLVILLAVQFVGGCSGSTQGGIKVRRLIAIKVYISAGMERIMHPGAVKVIEVDGQKMDSDDATSVLSTVLLYFLAFVIGTIQIISIEQCDFLDSIVLSVSALSNSGAILGTGASPEITDLTKMILCFMMYLGRLELVYVLLLFTRGFWRDVQQSVRRNNPLHLIHR